MAYSLRLTPSFYESVLSGKKTLELRIPTERNEWLIREMLSYKKGDGLSITFNEGHSPVMPLQATITKPSEQKTLADITDDEIARISGTRSLTREALMHALRGLYRRLDINGETNAVLAHFKLKDR